MSGGDDDTRPGTGEVAGSRILSKADFHLLGEIGEGSFSVVYHARRRDDQRECAIKMCFKKQILREKKVEQIMREKDIMAFLSRAENSYPLTACLFATFHDSDHLYFVLKLAKGGDLLRLLHDQPSERMDERCASFYVAEILLALEHIHSLGIVHRDMKPENCLLSGAGHIMVSDFGSATKKDEANPPPTPPPSRRCSFVGTAQYISPEVLRGQSAGPPTDFWALGVIAYQLLTGRHCFHDESEYLIFRRVEKLLFSFPADFPDTARALVDGLLRTQPLERLNAAALRAHPFLTAHWHLDTITTQDAPIAPPPFRSTTSI